MPRVPFCLEACPYKKIYFNFQREVSQHCILCFPRVEQRVAPACVRQCPGRAVWFGFMDDESGPIHKLVRKWEVALPLHAEYGTEPNIFYIPPVGPSRLNDDGSFDADTPRIPTEYLERLFGPRVRSSLATLTGEMQKTRGGGKSEMLGHAHRLLVEGHVQTVRPRTGRDPVAGPAARGIT